MYGAALRKMGRVEEAVAEYRRAQELDPLSLSSSAFLGVTFYEGRQYDQAIEQERKTLELDPNFTQANAVLGFAYAQKSMHKEAIAQFEKGLVVSPGDTRTLTGLGYAYAVAGRRAEAQKVLDQLTELSKEKYVGADGMALIYTGLGEKDKAFEWLEKAYLDGSIGGGTGIAVDPIFDPLRSDPRFMDILRRMNLQH
jgi:tetratricopeptide (TPR) repeat protein